MAWMKQLWHKIDSIELCNKKHMEINNFLSGLTPEYCGKRPPEQ